jgi:RNA polymerase sigma factor (sigma-70 family)
VFERGVAVPDPVTWTPFPPVSNQGAGKRPPDLTALQAEAEATLQLLQRARAGDRSALDALVARYLPRLQRWASGRMPIWARDVADTDDIVQEAVLRTFARLDEFEPRREGALQAYLRQAILNRIRDELRRAASRPPSIELDPHSPDPGASPFEHAVGTEMAERYEAALTSLSDDDREAIVARVELGGTYEEVAAALGKPTADAARMAVGRALLRLAEAMGRG